MIGDDVRNQRLYKLEEDMGKLQERVFALEMQVQHLREQGLRHNDSLVKLAGIANELCDKIEAIGSSIEARTLLPFVSLN